jgi:hypothetical protein
MRSKVDLPQPDAKGLTHVADRDWGQRFLLPVLILVGRGTVQLTRLLFHICRLARALLSAEPRGIRTACKRVDLVNRGSRLDESWRPAEACPLTTAGKYRKLDLLFQRGG